MSKKPTRFDLTPSNSFRKSSSITIREVGPADWQAYHNYYRALANPITFKGYLKDKNLDDPDTFKNLFEQIKADMTGARILALFSDDKMIGQVMYYHETEGDNKAIIAQGLEIADQYKGLGYFKKLTDAVMGHLRREIDPETKILTSIRMDNKASLRIAKAYGLDIVETGERADRFAQNGYHLLEYKGLS